MDAFGPLGIEGSYRRCCEIVLKELKNQTDTLNNQLLIQPIIYDPLLPWSCRRSKNIATREPTNAEAIKDIKHIENRLTGYLSLRRKRTQVFSTW